jgi:hypothetical protein
LYKSTYFTWSTRMEFLIGEFNFIARKMAQNRTKEINKLKLLFL